MSSTIPEVGNAAPDFNLQSSTGDTVSLAGFKGKKTVVLYFYPRADTPGCTKEACGFRDALADYDKANVAVLGISPDPVTEKYGVWQEKSMYGKKYMGAARTTFVIGKDGKILHIFEKVKPEGHDQEVLAWLKEAR